MDLPVNSLRTNAFGGNVKMADIDGDGDNDIGVSGVDVDIPNCADELAFALLRNDGSGNMVDPWPTGAGEDFHTNAMDVAFIDIDRDGCLDIFMGVCDGYKIFIHPDDISVFAGNGDGTFAGPQNYNAGGRKSSLVVADFNDDGHLDVGADQIWLLLGNGDGSLGVARQEAPGFREGISAGDLNGDDAVDVVFRGVAVALGKGDGTFGELQSFPAGEKRIHRVTISDLDNDGHPDLAAGGPGDGTGVFVLRGRGDGTFDSAQYFPIDSQRRSFENVAVVATDIDSDGALDLVTANKGLHDVSILLGHGDGTFEPAQRFAAGYAPADLAVGDLNGDKQPDIVVVSSSGVTVLLAQGGRKLAW